jgi:hypothetical protein
VCTIIAYNVNREILSKVGRILEFEGYRSLRSEQAPPCVCFYLSWFSFRYNIYLVQMSSEKKTKKDKSRHKEVPAPSVMSGTPGKSAIEGIFEDVLEKGSTASVDPRESELQEVNFEFSKVRRVFRILDSRIRNNLRA